MFTRQAPAVLNSLLSGGMDATAAFDLHNQLGQCQAGHRTNGTLTIDPTRPYMRLLTPTSPYPKPPLPDPVEFPPPPVGPTDGKDGKDGTDGRDGLPPEHDPGIPPPQTGPGETVIIIHNTETNNTTKYVGRNYIQVLDFGKTIGLFHKSKHRHCTFPRQKLGDAQGHINSVYFKPVNLSEEATLSIEEKTEFTEFSLSFAGSVRIGKAAANINKGSSGNVDLYYVDDCNTEGSSTTTITAHNLSIDIKTDQVVLVSKAWNGCWYIVEVANRSELRVATTSGAISKGSTGNVVWKFPTSCSTGTGATFEVHNLLRDVGSGVVVLVGQAGNGCWFIVDIEDKDCMYIGGTDLGELSGHDAARKQWLYKTTSDCIDWINGYHSSSDCAKIAGEDMTAISGRVANTQQALTMNADNCLEWVTISECP